MMNLEKLQCADGAAQRKVIEQFVGDSAPAAIQEPF